MVGPSPDKYRSWEKIGWSTLVSCLVVTDADGDKIFVEWKCAGVMPACPGTERFVGGTGKYTGISGNQKFQGNS